MKNYTQSKQNSTISFGARLFILLMLASILSSCGMIIETPVPTEANYELTPAGQNPATQELTLVPPTEVPTEIPTLTLTPEPTATATEMLIPTLDLESATAVEDMRKLKEMFETNKNIDNLVLAPEQIFSDFYNKVIPSESELRISIANNERYDLGDALFLKSGSARVQGILVGGFTTDNGAYLLLGTENSATGDRSIIPFQFTFGSEGPWSTVGVKRDSSQVKIMQYSVNSLEFISAEDLLIIVGKNLGKNVLTNILLVGYVIPQPLPEYSRIAREKYFLTERHKSNELFINDPLSIDKNNLIESPWAGYIIY